MFRESGFFVCNNCPDWREDLTVFSEPLEGAFLLEDNMEIDWTFQLKEKFKQILPNNIDMNYLKISQLKQERYDNPWELEFAKFLDKNKVNYIKYPQFSIDFNGWLENRQQKFTHTPDFYIPRTKMIIEVTSGCKRSNLKGKSLIMELLFPNALIYLNPHHLVITKSYLLGLFDKHQLSPKYREHLQLIYKKLGII